MQRLTGKTALVTGGGRGIGKAIGGRFAAEGATVVLCDVREDEVRQSAAELDEGAGKVRALCADVRDLDRISRAISELGAPLDVLVNNAAMAPRIPLNELTPADLDAVLKVNFYSAVFLSRTVGAIMSKAGTGSIVNIASVNAFRGQPEMLHYNTSKAALVSMTQTLAMEYANTGVRVNCVCPGSTWTDAWEEGGWHEPDQRAFAEKIPMRRFGRPEEIAAGVAFLASGDASYITGHALVIDGGLTARM